MGNSKLTFLFAVLGPLVLGAGACFLSTESGEYRDTYYGYDTDGNTCSVGAPGCPCTNSGACDTGLICIEMLKTCVVPDDCSIGAPGCACTNGGTCDEGLVCKENYCVSEQPCLPDATGTESCQCTAGGGCDPGLECLSGLCVDVSGLTTDGTSSGGTTGDSTTGGSTGPERTSESTTTDDGGSTTDDGDTEVEPAP